MAHLPTNARPHARLPSELEGIVSTERDALVVRVQVQALAAREAGERDALFYRFSLTLFRDATGTISRFA
jgi:hypothetical protein